MRVEHIREILSESIESGRGARAKNLKVYLRFYSKDQDIFEKDRRRRIENGKENEFESQIDKFTFYFDEWDWGILSYHTLDEDGTKRFEKFLRGHPFLRTPWVKKLQFEELIRDFIKDGGRVVKERVLFEPHNDYSGYGIAV